MKQLHLRPIYQMHWRSHSLLYCSLLLIQSACFSQAVQNTDWKVFSLGDPQLQIQLPGEVTPMESSVPWELINRLQRFDTYRFYHAEGKLVAIFKFIQYNTPIEETTPALLEKEIAEVMKSIKAEQVLHSEKNFKLKKIPGCKSTGSFILHQQQWIFQDMLLRNDSSMWQVWIAAEESDPVYAKTMKDIVKSIGF